MSKFYKGEQMKKKKYSTSTAAVNAAIDEAIKILMLRSDRQLALMLDIEKQNVAAWRSRGELPAARAVQIEFFTRGEITWEALCPKLLEETENLMAVK